MPHVLIVDDFDLIRLMLRFVLEREGYSIYAETDDGDEAFALLRASPYRLIVTTDHAHLGMSGDELLRRVAQDPILSARHVYLLISANIQIGRSSDALRRLDGVFIPKPFKPAVISEALRRAARQLQAREESAPQAPISWPPTKS
jgi:CheY-like chemotaxis protein